MSDQTTESPNGSAAAALAGLRANQTASIASAPAVRRSPVAVGPERDLPDIKIGFGNLKSFEFTQRAAMLLASSTMVPEQYRLLIPNKRNKSEMIDNPNGVSNCVVALNMADRLKVDVLTVMQNLHIIEGRPSWSSQFVIASINASGLFSPLRWEIKEDGFVDAQYHYTEWVDRQPAEKTLKVRVRNITFRAHAKDKASGETVWGPPVSMVMAVQEGWYTRKGSKWQTMPEVMGAYRSAAFFGRLNCPELTMGLRTMEEEGDILQAQQGPDGVWTADLSETQGANLQVKPAQLENVDQSATVAKSAAEQEPEKNPVETQDPGAGLTALKKALTGKASQPEQRQADPQPNKQTGQATERPTETDSFADAFGAGE